MMQKQRNTEWWRRIQAKNKRRKSKQQRKELSEISVFLKIEPKIIGDKKTVWKNTPLL